MPANLTPEYLKAEEAFREAETDEDKLACLKHMLAVIPRHKGTDHLQADLRRRMSRLREKIDQVKQSRKRGFSHRVHREGAGQVALAGPPNVGKSQLLAALTNATPEVADYPFTTHEPIPGMTVYKGVQIQLIDLPPVSEVHTERWVYDCIKAADLVALITDLGSNDPLEQVERLIELLWEAHICLIGSGKDGEADFRFKRLRALAVANKSDMDGADEMIALLKDMWSYDIPLLVASAESGQDLHVIQETLFERLELMRIFSKEPSKDPDLDAPFAILRDSTVVDFAKAVHNEMAEEFKFARVWGSSKFDGQVVPRDHVLKDGDIVEIHT